MDGSRFDQLARALTQRSPRRKVLHAAGGMGLGMIAAQLGSTDTLGKRKKCKAKLKCGKKCCRKGQLCVAKKCVTPCTFTTTGTVMQLKANCTATSVIEIPNGFTLDGNNKSIDVAKKAPAGAAAVILARSGQAYIRNLRLYGTGQGDVSIGCGNMFGQVGIRFEDTAGEIADVIISETCSSAIEILASGGQEVAISRLMVDNPGDGISIRGTSPDRVKVRIDDCALQRIPNVAISVTHASAEIANTMLSDVMTGIGGDDSDVSISGGSITRVRLHGASIIGRSTLDVNGVTITGTGINETAAYGVYFGRESTGSATDNTISEFTDGDDLHVSCGIAVSAEADEVFIDGNIFTQPSGNEEDICRNV